MKNITFMLALDSGAAINKNVVVPNTWDLISLSRHLSFQATIY